MTRRFADRQEAGRALAQRLSAMSLPAPVVVLALPRGGVPVAAQVAKALGAPLDLILVRKIGAPWEHELAIAAVVDVGQPEIVVDEQTRAYGGVDRSSIEAQARKEWQEIERRRLIYRRGRPAVPLEGATAIVVDDGIATGTTVRAALRAVRRRHPARLILAVPVAPRETVLALQEEVDQIVCLEQPHPFHAIGLHYDDFHQLDDNEVIAALDQVAPGPSGTPAPP